MNFIETPNLPRKPVRLAAVDCRISRASEEALLGIGVRLIKTGPHKGLYNAVSSHPDMLIHHIGGNLIVHAPGIEDELRLTLQEAGFRLLKGETVLERKYPKDIPYNAARIGGFWFHNTRYTDPVLRRELERKGIEPVHVEQGYTKCSMAVIDENTIITSDAGIARSAESKGIEVLLVEPRQNILLPGLDYGFIGGATGLVDKNTLAVNGDACRLKSYDSIISFLNRKNCGLLSLSTHEVTDAGSILPLMTV